MYIINKLHFEFTIYKIVCTNIYTYILGPRGGHIHIYCSLNTHQLIVAPLV